MTELERQQEQEIRRLQQKVKSLSEAYQRAALELEQLKREAHETGKRGRPSVSDAKKARVITLYGQGNTMRAIAEKEQIAAGTVHKIIAEAVKESRVVYVYADREEPATIIDACALTRKVKIVNLTDDLLSRAFGVREHPGWEDYEEFLESRCMPRTRFGIREELSYMGIDSYDPFLILDKTGGRVYGDHQYLIKMKKDWIAAYDELMKEIKAEEGHRERLLAFLRASEGEWKLNEDQY